ncbi:MAG: hypothetical protein ABT02_18360 [Comamonadaceae bacterium SCN 68-20]|nr:MAG: hypothetical protein ABT02_18360 [Comamonadaceae bacterium SCN 68-20]
MLPTRLGMASLRHTRRLRRNTGHQRHDRSGGRQIEAGVSMSVSPQPMKPAQPLRGVFLHA